MFCAVKSLKVKLIKARSEFPTVWGEYKNHSNPYNTGYYRTRMERQIRQK
jgi:hypothetical protein